MKAQSITFKVSALILALFACYAAAQFIVQQRIVYPSFVALEEMEARKNGERAIKALERELQLLDPLVIDWANWDSTYEFLHNRNPAYEAENLTTEALQNLNLNYLGFVRLDGEIVWHRAINLETAEILKPAALGLNTFTPTGPLLKGAVHRANESVLGIHNSRLGPVLLAARPVLRSSGDGPPRGIAIMGRLLDAAGVERLARQAQVNLAVESVPAGIVSRPNAALDSGVSYSVAPLITEASTIHSIITIFDLAFRPALQLRIDTPRDITRQGEKTLQVAQITLAAAGVVVLSALLLTLNRTVFSPISKLTRHATIVGTSADVEERLELARDDEIGVLGREFDRMVERLAEARARLLEQSYKAGIAEMASGVLHNIGNAVTPLGVKLSGLVAALRDAPQREIALANQELADPSTPADRRRDLTEFMVLAATELGTLAGHVASGVSSAIAHVDHIQLTLADQQRFARAERVLEPLKIARLVKECIALLPINLQHIAEIDLSPTLDLAPDIRSSRAALSQIISNLLLNAAESVQEQRGHGHIRISAQVAEYHGAAVLRAEIADNGVGIAAEALARIFEAGVSSKSRGSGMGLHWCANTAAAMGGALWAESAGLGTGARLVLILPLAAAAHERTEAAA